MSLVSFVAILRHVLSFAGGFVVAKGWMDAGLFEQLTGGIVAVASVAWSLYEKAKNPPAKVIATPLGLMKNDP